VLDWPRYEQELLSSTAFPRRLTIADPSVIAAAAEDLPWHGSRAASWPIEEMPHHHAAGCCLTVPQMDRMLLVDSGRTAAS